MYSTKRKKSPISNLCTTNPRYITVRHQKSLITNILTNYVHLYFFMVLLRVGLVCLVNLVDWFTCCLLQTRQTVRTISTPKVFLRFFIREDGTNKLSRNLSNHTRTYATQHRRKGMLHSSKNLTDEMSVYFKNLTVKTLSLVYKTS